MDADTKVLPDAITYMVAAMANDITIMGLCGETRIANKRASCKSTINIFFCIRNKKENRTIYGKQ